MLRIILALFIAAPVMASEAKQDGQAAEKPGAVQPSKPSSFSPGLNRWGNPDGTVGAVQNDSIGMGPLGRGKGRGDPNGAGGRR